MYAELLLDLQTSGLGQLARQSAWLYTAANLLHVLGAALLVGAIAVLDLRLLAGSAGGIAATARTAIPLAAAGLALQVPTGILLLAPEAVALGQNPAFYAKVLFIAAGIANLALFHARHGWGFHDGMRPASTRFTALISLTAWIAALLAGRLIAYL